MVQSLGERLNRETEQYLRLCAERRGGKVFQRRRKSLILTIVEHYLQLLEFAVIASDNSAAYVRRRDQAWGVHAAVKNNQLPRRGDPIIPSAADEELESEFADSVRSPADAEIEEEIEEIEEEEEQGGSRPSVVPPWRSEVPPWRREPAVPRAPSVVSEYSSSSFAVLPKATGGVPSFSRLLSASSISAVPPSVPKTPPKAEIIAPKTPPKAKVVLKTTSKGSGAPETTSKSAGAVASESKIASKARPPCLIESVPKAVPERQPLLDLNALRHRNCSVFDSQGQQIFPQRELNFGPRSVISIDFHNVLDVHRFSNKYRVVAVEGEHGIPSQCRQAVQRLKDLGLAVIVTSYVHTDWRKRHVVESCSTLPVDQIVICQKGDGTRFAGKLDCLRLLCPPKADRSLIHIDDKGRDLLRVPRRKAGALRSLPDQAPGQRAVSWRESV